MKEHNAIYLHIYVYCYTTLNITVWSSQDVQVDVCTKRHGIYMHKWVLLSQKNKNNWISYVSGKCIEMGIVMVNELSQTQKGKYICFLMWILDDVHTHMFDMKAVGEKMEINWKEEEKVMR